MIKFIKRNLQKKKVKINLDIFNKMFKKKAKNFFSFKTVRQFQKKSLIEVEVVNYFNDNETILDIRPLNEQENNPLKINGIKVVSLPFYKLNTEFSDLDQSKIWLLWCERGVMSRLQAIYLREQGFYNVKVYRCDTDSFYKEKNNEEV